MHAVLPQHLRAKIESKIINRMVTGQSGWTVPWAMGYDKDGWLWINGDYTFHNHSGGTVQMKISRTANGYEVALRSESCGSLHEIDPHDPKVDWLSVAVFTEIN